MAEKKPLNPAEAALIAFAVLLVALALYLALSGMTFVAVERAEEYYTCYYADGPSLVEVRLYCPLRYEAYVNPLSPKLLASAPKCVVASRQAFPPGAPAANGTVRAVRLPDGAWAVEAPNGTVAPAVCLRG